MSAPYRVRTAASTTRILARLRAGDVSAHIAADEGCDPATVSRLAKANGIEVPHRGGRKGGPRRTTLKVRPPNKRIGVHVVVDVTGILDVNVLVDRVKLEQLIRDNAKNIVVVDDDACPHDPDGMHHLGCGCDNSDFL